jgi:hypothetical protein
MEYFSYEHFYVIYCKFWELDKDHDLLIDKDELLKYGGSGLSSKVVERVFSFPRFTSSKLKIPQGKLHYQDFVCKFFHSIFENLHCKGLFLLKKTRIIQRASIIGSIVWIPMEMATLVFMRWKSFMKTK